MARTWQDTGFEGGGNVNVVDISLVNNDHMVAGSDAGGFSVSLDGGVTWETGNNGLFTADQKRVAAVMFHPTIENVVYALVGNGTNGGFLQSLDGGSTWAVKTTTFVGSAHSPSPRPVGNLIAIDATNNFLYVGSYRKGIYRAPLDGSGNVGSFTLIGLATDGGGNFYYVRSLAINPNNPDLLFASTNITEAPVTALGNGKVYRSTTHRTQTVIVNGVGCFSTELTGVPANSEEIIVVPDSTGAPNLYAAAPAGLYRFPAQPATGTAGTVGGGTAWTALAGAPTAAGQTYYSIEGVFSPDDLTTTVYLGNITNGTGPSYVKFFSPDDFTTGGFTVTTYDSTNTVNNVAAAAPTRPWWLYSNSASYMPGRSSYFASHLKANPGDEVPGSTIFASGKGGIWQTPDSGATWYPYMRHLDVSGVRMIEVNPRNKDIIYFASNDWNFAYSLDHGQTVVLDAPASGVGGFDITTDPNVTPVTTYLATGNSGNADTQGDVYSNVDVGSTGGFADTWVSTGLGAATSNLPVIGVQLVKQSNGTKVLYAAVSHHTTNANAGIWRKVLPSGAWTKLTVSAPGNAPTDGIMTNQATHFAQFAWRPDQNFIYVYDRNSGVFRGDITDATGSSWKRIYNAVADADEQTGYMVTQIDTDTIYVSRASGVFKISGANSIVVEDGATATSIADTTVFAAPSALGIDNVNRLLYASSAATSTVLPKVAVASFDSPTVWADISDITFKDHANSIFGMSVGSDGTVWMGVQETGAVQYPPPSVTPPSPTKNVFGLGQTALAGDANRTKKVNAAGLLMGAGHTIRSDMTLSNVARGATLSFSGGGGQPNHDALMADIAANRLVSLPALHTNVSTSNAAYTVPASDGIGGDPTGAGGMQGWYEFVTAACDHYAPGGTFSATGWTPITNWELWNEPNSAIGDTGTSAGGFSGSSTLDQNGIKRLAVSDLYKIIRDGSKALENHGAANGWQPYIVAPGLASIDLIYLKSLIDYFVSQGDNLFTRVDAISVHLYMNDDPDAPGGTGSALSNRVKSLSNLRDFLDANNGSTCRIWITEGGYAGSDKWNTYQNTFNAITIPQGSIDQKVVWSTRGHVGGAPTIASFTPTSATVGSTVTITGTGFTGTTSVTIAGIPCTFSVTNDTTILASVPSVPSLQEPSFVWGISALSGPSPSVLAGELGRTFNGARFNSDITKPFPGPLLQTEFDAGRVVSYRNADSTQTISNVKQAIPWRDVANGLWDSTITAAALAVKADPRWSSQNPYLFSFHHEQSVNTASQPGGASAGTSADYIAAYRHVRALWDAAGATVQNVDGSFNADGNARFCFVPDFQQYLDNTKPYYVSAVDPGQQYYDFIGADIYSKIDTATGNTLKFPDPAVQLTPIHDYAVSVGKQFIIGEWGIEDTQVPSEALWLYTAPSTSWCQIGVAPSSSHIPTAEAFANNTRQFWISDYGGEALLAGKAPYFNPDARTSTGATFLDASSVQAVPVDWTGLHQDNAGTGAAGHAVSPVGNILGGRSLDGSWPPGGISDILNWTYGDGSYVDQCVNKWNALMIQVTRRTLVRMWHEQGNMDNMQGVSGADFIAAWRKICIRLRALGGLAPNKCQIVWCPASHPTNPSDDSTTFPGTYPTQPGGTDVIGRDMYPKTATTWENAGQLWYNSYNPFTGGLNTDHVPLVVCESGLETADPNRSAKLTELANRLKGNHAQPWTGISGWIWWDGANNDLVDTPAGFKATWASVWNDPVFIPNGIVPFSGSTPPGVSTQKPAYIDSVHSILKTYGQNQPGACFAIMWTSQAPPTDPYYALDSSPATLASNASFATDPFYAFSIPTSGGGTGKITVTTPGGTATSTGNFTVGGPNITGFSPNAGPVGQSVTITGTGFTGITVVTFNGINAAFTVVDDSTIITTVPATASSGPIVVNGPAGSNNSGTSFTVTSNPTGTITQGASVSADTGTATVTISAPPAGTVTNDVLVAHVTARAATAITTAPVGWVASTPASDASGDKVVENVYTKVVTNGSTEAGTSYTWGATGATGMMATVTRFSGVDTTTPLVGTASTGASSAKSIVTTIGNVASVPLNGLALTFASSTAAARPWADTGTLLTLIPFSAVGAGAYSTQAGVSAWETLIGRTIAMGHSWLPWAFGAGTWPPAGNTLGPNSDLANQRMTFLSWPREQDWPDGNPPTRVPSLTLNDIAQGKWDDLLAQNALAMKNFSHPLWFRPFCEVNGGDHPWEIGYETASTIGTFAARFNAAWARMYTVTKGTQAQVTALSPGYGANLRAGGTSIATINGGNAVNARNVIFFWNPQNFETTTVHRDLLYPGDAFTDAAGVEAYLAAANGDGQSGSATTYTALMTVNWANHKAIYDYFQTNGKLIAHGEAGNRWAGGSTSGTGDFDACMSRTNSYNAISTFPGTKVLSWWNGGSVSGNGDSAIEDQPTAIQNAAKAFLNSNWMKPKLSITWDTSAMGNWDEQYNTRCTVGTNKTNFDNTHQVAQLMLSQVQPNAGTATLNGFSAPMYGYANWASHTVALRPAGSVGGSPPTVSTFTPTSGTVGTSVTITGNNFTGTTLVTFGGVSATFTVVSNTSITATVPSGAPSGVISVTNATSTGSSSGNFGVLPTITNFTPTSGPVGSTVTITGSGFAGATSVKFNGTSASFTITNATTISATVPVNATSGAISVTTPAGTATTTGGASGIWNTTPVAGTPGSYSSAWTSGNTHAGRTYGHAECNGVIYTGGWSDHTVDGDGTDRTNTPYIWAINPTTKRVIQTWRTTADGFVWDIKVAPDKSAIYVSGEFNNMCGSPANGFAALKPLTGPTDTSAATLHSSHADLGINGGPATRMAVDSTGNNLWLVGGFSSPTMGILKLKKTGGIWGRDTAFTGTVPGVSGTSSFLRACALKPDSTILVAGGSNTTNAMYAFNATTGAALTWSYQPNAAPGIYDIVADNAVVYSGGGAAAGDVLVATTWTGGGPNSFTLGTAFNAHWYRTVDGNVQAVALCTIGGQSVVCFGHHGDFRSSAKNTNDAQGSPLNAKGFWAVTGGATGGNDAGFGNPPSFSGGADSSVLKIFSLDQGGETGNLYAGGDFTNVNGEANDLHRRFAMFLPTGTGGGFTVTGGGGGSAPTITSFTPTSGGSGTSVTITGTNFTGTTQVTVGGVVAGTFTVNSATQIVFTAPNGVRTGKVTVTNSAGTATSTGNFTAAAPTITSFSPTTGNIGQSVSIVGTDFTGATAVHFNGTTASFSIVDDKHVGATVPSGATNGTLNIVTPNGTGTSSGTFTVGGGGGANPPSQIGIIIFENASASAVSGDAGATTFHNLKATYRDNTNYQNLTLGSGAAVHPSLPNYCGLISGSLLGKNGTDSGTVGFAGTAGNLFKQVGDSGRTWKAYEEGVTGRFGTWLNESGGQHYATRHCPAAFFTNTSAGGVGGGNGRYDVDRLVSDINAQTLPDFFFVTPDLNDDAHTTVSGSGLTDLAWGDRWLRGLNPQGRTTAFAFQGVTALMNAMRPDSVLLIIFDEGSGTSTQYTVMCGNNVARNVDNAHYSHYALLYGIQLTWSLPKFVANPPAGNLEVNYTSLTSATALPFPTF